MKKFLNITFLVVFLFVLSACSDSAINNSSGNNNTSTGTEEGSNTETIKIGMTTALTGPASEYGVGNSRGVGLAIDKWNANGGINGKKIELVLYDDQLATDKGVANMQKLLADSSITAIIGPAGSNVALATVPLTESKGVVHMNPGSQTIEITYANGVEQKPRKNVYSFAMQNDVEGEAIASFLGENFKKIAILNESTAYGQTLAEIVIENLKNQYNIEPVAHEEYNAGVPDMTAQLSILKRSEPEIIVSFGVAADTANVRKGIDRMAIDTQFLSTALTPPYFSATGDLAIGTLTSTMNALATDKLSNEALEFAEAYKDKFGIDQFWGTDPENPQLSMSVFVLTAYDAANVLFNAMKNAESLDSESIIAALEDTTDYKGVNGIYTFDENRHHAISKESIGIFEYIKEGDKFIPVPYK